MTNWAIYLRGVGNYVGYSPYSITPPPAADFTVTDDPAGKIWDGSTVRLPTQQELDAMAAAAAAEVTRVDTIKAAVQSWIDALTARDLTTIDNFVRGTIDADSVTDLATAKVALKKCETGIASLAKIIAVLLKRPM